ncbi:helix-turn-helix domain-containing protein [Marinobacterium marinum]|uniref:Helix-turn-helix transcriptional regulator n=1 Tax=Marinobacterium marinum TaxID=2756129 RepID=A0A7W2ACN8_9GAMM|nr:helix-turn-helix transcriptional regulator [Marinobacterium marinum]MBA4502303.1 helix-turn-helix transcriptional regulator [Marinobacterium marinum]
MPCPDVQVIKQAGQPAFAVIPYDEYLVLLRANQRHLPARVVEMQTEGGLSRIAAWRSYRGMSQSELAERLGITQSSVARLERVDVTPRQRTLERVAIALGCTVEQLLLRSE